MRANEVLKAALGHMEDRAATYDKPEGERSMPATVSAFNALTGHQLTAEQGWLFMTVLKLCRTQQGGFRADNYEDGAAYFALMGEQAAGDRGQYANVDPTQGKHLEPLSDDPYGPRDAEGWYTWNGDETMRPAGNVDVEVRDGVRSLRRSAEQFEWAHCGHSTDIVKWRPGQ